MKITKSQLKQIIKEELEKSLEEKRFFGDPDVETGGRSYFADLFQNAPWAKKHPSKWPEHIKQEYEKWAAKRKKAKADPEEEPKKLAQPDPEDLERAGIYVESAMKITKSQLKQIIKEEISKVLNEGPDINTMEPVAVLKQMISDKVTDKLYGQDRYTYATDENIKAYLNSIKDTEDFKLALNVIEKVQAAAHEAIAAQPENPRFDFRKELGISGDDDLYQGGYGPLGDPYGDFISAEKWYNDLLENRPLFDDLIENFRKYVDKYIYPGGY